MKMKLILKNDGKDQERLAQALGHDLGLGVLPTIMRQLFWWHHDSLNPCKAEAYRFVFEYIHSECLSRGLEIQWDVMGEITLEDGTPMTITPLEIESLKKAAKAKAQSDIDDLEKMLKLTTGN